MPAELSLVLTCMNQIDSTRQEQSRLAGQLAA